MITKYSANKETMKGGKKKVEIQRKTKTLEPEGGRKDENEASIDRYFMCVFLFQPFSQSCNPLQRQFVRRYIRKLHD